MSISALIEPISDKGSTRINGQVMPVISALSLEVLNAAPDAPYNWDVISLYFTPQNRDHPEKSSYGREDGLACLNSWLNPERTVSSTCAGRALQGLEHIMEMAGKTPDVGKIHTLENLLIAQYRQIDDPID